MSTQTNHKPSCRCKKCLAELTEPVLEALHQVHQELDRLIAKASCPKCGDNHCKRAFDHQEECIYEYAHISSDTEDPIRSALERVLWAHDPDHAHDHDKAIQHGHDVLNKLVRIEEDVAAPSKSGEIEVRRIEDINGSTLSYAELKALASGNPLVLEKTIIASDVIKLKRAYRAFQDRQLRSRIKMASISDRIGCAERMLIMTKSDLEVREDTTGDLFQLNLGGTIYADRTEAASALRQRLIALTHTPLQRRAISIGKFAGFDLQVSIFDDHAPELLISGYREYTSEISLVDSIGSNNLQSLELLPRRIEKDIEKLKGTIKRLSIQFAELEGICNEQFPHQDELDTALARQTELKRLLSEKE